LLAFSKEETTATMVAGMKFLSKKGFNPQNLTNQKRVWEKQQEKKQEEQKIKERHEQLKREKDDEELARARGEPVHLKFMYEPPPGMEAAAANKKPSPDDAQSSIVEELDTKMPAVKADNHDITQIQPGDDSAAAAFRRMLAAASSGQHELEDEEFGQQQQGTQQSATAYGTVLQGTSIEKETKTKAELSALEKAVGRRDGNQGLSLEEQVARFPQLKNAPMAKGMSGTDVGVSFKPLGAQLRNVRCLACGTWGHSRGERECPKSGWNPFEHVAKTPSTSISKRQPQDAIQQEEKSRESPRNPKNGNDEQSVNSTEESHSSEDSYWDRKRRKKSKRKDRKKESKKSRRRSRSESPDRKRHRRSRSESLEQDRSRSRKKSKKSRKKESSRK
jgi:CBF1 interacting corepressor